MVATISSNPYQTTNALGSFGVESTGYVQGTAQDDPAIRYKLAGGVLAQSETIVLWGGVGIYEAISGAAGGPLGSLGSIVGRATNVTPGAVGQLAGFSVSDQNYASISNPQNPVGLVGSGGRVHFYRLGSGARIAVQIDPALADMIGENTNTPVSWDFNQQRLVPFSAAEAAETITGITWANGVATVTTAAAHGYVAGDDVTLTGQVPSGYSGDQTILSVPTTTTFTYGLPVNPGTETTPGVISAGGGALNVRVLGIELGNSMTISQDPVTGFVSWNRSGSTALILI